MGHHKKNNKTKQKNHSLSFSYHIFSLSSRKISSSCIKFFKLINTAFRLIWFIYIYIFKIVTLIPPFHGDFQQCKSMLADFQEKKSVLCSLYEASNCDVTFLWFPIIVWKTGDSMVRKKAAAERKKTTDFLFHSMMYVKK